MARCGPVAVSRQQGGMAVSMMLVMIGLVSILGLVEIGYLYWAKRDVQKVADLAALAGAQRLDLCAPGHLSNEAARSNAVDDNDFTGTLTIECGHWSAEHPSEDHFAFDPSLPAPNAVRVVARRAAIPFFGAAGPLPMVEARAIAKSGLPMAAFTVGSTLARLDWNDDSRPILGALLEGIGLDLDDTSLIGYNGLADAKVSPSGLLHELGIDIDVDATAGQINSVLAADAQVRPLVDVIDATIRLADPERVLGLNASVLANAIATKLGVSDLLVRIGSQVGQGAGLFAEIIAPDGSVGSALGTQVNALDLVYAAIGAATQKHAIEIPNLGVVPTLGVVSAKAAVIEPPSIGLGGVGATAYTAQVRTYVKVDTGSVPLIGSLINVKLPIMIDTVAGRGTISEMCTADLRDGSGNDRARIAVDAQILKVCIGRPGTNAAQETQVFSTSTSCEQYLAPEQLLRVGLLGVNVASLNTKIAIDALPANGDLVLAQGETGTVGNPLALGATTRSITDALLAALLVNAVNGSSGSAVSPIQRTEMAQKMWDAKGPDCGSSSACRRARLAAIDADIRAAGSGLGGFLGNLSGATLNILGSLLSLNLLGLLNGIGSLVGGLLGLLGDLLGGILSGLLGNSCTGGLLFGSGTDAGCVGKIAESLQGNSSGGGQQAQNALIALAGFLLDLLQPILDTLGNLLVQLLQDILGLRLGEIDVHLETLDCNQGAQLVY